MIRIFLAFDISDEIRQNLTTFLKPFSSFKGVRWVDPKNYHVTLKFFGDVDEEKELPAIQRTIEAFAAPIKPVTLTCEGIGFFPKVIWAGFTASVLHLTLARITADPKKLAWLEQLKAAPQKQFGQVLVDHVTLYKSQLTKEGPVYTSLKEFPFKN